MIIADTGFWLALANQKDRYHSPAKECLELYNEGLITTWPVLTETCHLLLNRLGVFAELAFIRSLNKGVCSVFELSSSSYPRILELMKKYRSLPMDLADASLVLLAENLGHGKIFSTDKRDFHTYRWKNREPFENLLSN